MKSGTVKQTTLTFKQGDDLAEKTNLPQYQGYRIREIDLELRCFIFSHSALREGWDSPNVFQICTLNQTVSEMKKRQEIGRGVRLAVNQEGKRVHDEKFNVLTVVANQSYTNYVRQLQFANNIITHFMPKNQGKDS